MSELLPCPFCSAKNLSYDSIGCLEIKGRTHQKCWIVCDECGAEGPVVDVVDDTNASEVSEKWNTRAPAISDELKAKVLELCDTVERFGVVTIATKQIREMMGASK